MQQPASDVTGPRAPGLVATLRTPGVLLGILAMFIVSIAVMTPGFTPSGGLDQIAPLRIVRRILRYQVGRVLMVIGLALLLWAWLKLRPALYARLNHGLILTLWSLPILLSPPLFTTDPFLYADQGWLIHLGLDPYRAPLAEFEGPFAANVHEVWRGTTAIYPPLALWVQYLITVLTGFSGYVSVIAMRLPILAAVAVIAIFVPKVARQLGVNPETAKWFALINPLLLIHFVGGMHNDAWMVSLVLVAVWASLRYGTPGSLVGAVLVGIGAGFKQPGIVAAFAIALIPVAAQLKEMPPLRRLLVMLGRALVATVIAVGTFTLVSLAIGYEFLGWRHATNIGELTWGMSPASLIEQIVGPPVRWLGLSVNLLPIFSKLTTALSMLGMAVVAWRYFFADVWWPRRIGSGAGPRLHSVQQLPGQQVRETDRGWGDHPVRWLAWGFCSVAFGGAGYHVWYLLWGGIYLGMLRYGNRVFRMLTAVIILFIVVEGGLEYLGLRPIAGYLVGGGLGWIFWANSTGLRIVPDSEPAPDPEPAAGRSGVPVS